MLQSSQKVRPKKGTDGNKRRDSLITHSRYRSLFRSSMDTGRSEVPETKHKNILINFPEMTLRKQMEMQNSASIIWSLILNRPV